MPNIQTILDAAVRIVRSRMPISISDSYLDEFVIRRRGELTEMITDQQECPVAEPSAPLPPIQAPRDYSEVDVPAERIPWLRDQIDEMNRKAERLGKPPIVLTVSEEPIVKDWWPRDDPDHLGEPWPRTYYHVTVQGFRPRIEGWGLLAVLDHTAGAQNLVYSFGHEVDPAWRTADPLCEHCHTVRRRNMTFVLHHEGTGDVRQVGSTCVSDFLGGASPQAILDSAAFQEQLVRMFRELDEEGDGGFGGKVSQAHTQTYLAFVVREYQEFGWHRAGTLESTAQSALKTYLDFVKHGRGKLPDSDHRDLAKKIIDWSQSLTGRTDWEHNVKVLLASPYLSLRHVNIGASAIVGYHRDLERKAREAAAAREMPVPDWEVIRERWPVGSRVQGKVLLLGQFEREGEYGISTIHRFRDDIGVPLVWFSSSGPLRQHVDDPLGEYDRTIEIGEEITIVGTVKAHKTYRDQPNVSLSRVAIAPPPKVPKPRRAKGQPARDKARASLRAMASITRDRKYELIEGSVAPTTPEISLGTDDEGNRWSVAFTNQHHSGTPRPFNLGWMIARTPIEEAYYWWIPVMPDNLQELLEQAQEQGPDAIDVGALFAETEKQNAVHQAWVHMARYAERHGEQDRGGAPPDRDTPGFVPLHASLPFDEYRLVVEKDRLTLAEFKKPWAGDHPVWSIYRDVPITTQDVGQWIDEVRGGEE